MTDDNFKPEKTNTQVCDRPMDSSSLCESDVSIPLS